MASQELEPSILPDPLATLLRDSVRERVSLGESWARVERHTLPGGRVLFLKAGVVGGPHPIEDEIARLEWMTAKGLPVPRIVEHVAHHGVQYLVTEALPGVDASAYRGAGGPRGIVATLAAAMSRLHSTPIADCPFRHDAASMVRDAAERVRAGYVDSPAVDPARARRDAETQLERLIHAHETLVARQVARETIPPEGPVFTHGDYCLPNVIVREHPDHRESADEPTSPGLSGFIDCGRAGVADRYRDLALCARSITRNLGSAWIPAFFDDYGLPLLDRERIDFYTLLDDFF
jgi:aminoglycoside phosphotransferase